MSDQQIEPITERSLQTNGLQRNSFKHDWLNFAFVFVNLISYILVIFFNLASSLPRIGIFPTRSSNEVEILPAGWTFSTFVIFFWWLEKIFYSISSYINYIKDNNICMECLLDRLQCGHFVFGNRFGKSLQITASTNKYFSCFHFC